MADGGNAVDLIIQDHREVEQLFQQYEATMDAADRVEIVHQVVHELAVHGEVEELLVYPRVRDALPDGDALADEAVDEHLAMKQTLNDLDSMSADDVELDDRMRELMAEVRHHVQEEESGLLPGLRQALSDDDLRDLGSKLDSAKAVVPTRPHPSAPTGPAAKMAASPPVALVDRVRDAVRSWSDERR
ncbi:MAG: hemerythrin domain-containing protein [Actinomycetota bacterium]|nr:hemerythrin domain-containing protein [Actinomycetota bacterium]